jgi:hypothetical protein
MKDEEKVKSHAIRSCAQKENKLSGPDASCVSLHLQFSHTAPETATTLVISFVPPLSPCDMKECLLDLTCDHGRPVWEALPLSDGQLPKELQAG